MEKFQLKDQEYIQLNQLLKATGVVATGGEAMVRIDEGLVYVNDKIETQRRKKIRVGDSVKYIDDIIVVVK